MNGLSVSYMAVAKVQYVSGIRNDWRELHSASWLAEGIDRIIRTN